MNIITTMAPTDPIPPAALEGPLEHPGASLSLTPKRKPLMVASSTPKSTEKKDGISKEESSKQTIPSSSSKQPKSAAAWPYPYDYRRGGEEPGVFSPTTYHHPNDRTSMQVSRLFQYYPLVVVVVLWQDILSALERGPFCVGGSACHHGRAFR